MGIEDVPVVVFRIDGENRFFFDKRKSTYHGDFVFRLPPGKYVFAAETTLPSPEGTLFLEGESPLINVDGKKKRIDQVVIPLMKKEPS